MILKGCRKCRGIELVPEDRYYVNSPEDNNCCCCLVNRKGPMTQEEIGKFMGLSKMRISQIQKSGVLSLKKRIHPYVN